MTIRSSLLKRLPCNKHLNVAVINTRSRKIINIYIIYKLNQADAKLCTVV